MRGVPHTTINQTEGAIAAETAAVAAAAAAANDDVGNDVIERRDEGTRGAGGSTYNNQPNSGDIGRMQERDNDCLCRHFGIFF